MSIVRTINLGRQVSIPRLHNEQILQLICRRRQSRLIHVSSICKAKSEPVTYHVRSTNTTKKGKGQIQAKQTYSGKQESNVKGGKKDSLWKSWQNLTLGTKMGVAFAIGLVGVVGLITSDYLEQRMPEQENNGDVKTPKKTRLLGISVVDRKDASK